MKRAVLAAAAMMALAITQSHAEDGLSGLCSGTYA